MAWTGLYRVKIFPRPRRFLRTILRVEMGTVWVKFIEYGNEDCPPLTTVIPCDSIEQMVGLAEMVLAYNAREAPIEGINLVFLVDGVPRYVARQGVLEVEIRKPMSIEDPGIAQRLAHSQDVLDEIAQFLGEEDE